MKDETKVAGPAGEASPSPCRTRFSGNTLAASPRPRGEHPWRLRPSLSYLRAVREADRAVARAALRYAVLRHSARTLAA